MADAPKQLDPKNPKNARTFLERKRRSQADERFGKHVQEIYEERYPGEEYPANFETAPNSQVELVERIVDELEGRVPGEEPPAGDDNDDTDTDKKGKPADGDTDTDKKGKVKPKTIAERLSQIEEDLAHVQDDHLETRAVTAMIANRAVGKNGKLRGLNASDLVNLPKDVKADEIFNELKGEIWK